MLRVLLGIVIGVILVPAAVMGWFKFGHPPVAVADKPLPYERNIVAVPMRARIDSDMVKNPPIQADEATFVAGAQIYRDNCAACHGYHGKPVAYAAHMYPRTPALWEKHRTGDVVGVSDDPPGKTYWKIANGIRLSGMPSYNGVLSQTQMWQVTLLLANANKSLPPSVLALLAPEPPTASAPVIPAKMK